MSNRAISAIGFTLGLAAGAVGITLSLRAIQNHRYPPAKTYSQSGAVATSINNLRGVQR